MNSIIFAVLLLLSLSCLGTSDESVNFLDLSLYALQCTSMIFNYLGYLRLKEGDCLQNRSIDLKLINVSSTYPLNYSLAIEDEFFYFLYEIDRPSIVEMYFDLQIKPVVPIGTSASQQFKVSNIFDPLGFTINYLLELPIQNATLLQIIKSKDKLLNFFKTKLWKVNQKNDKLTIVYIVPDPSNAGTFIVGLGSEYKEPFKMSRILLRLRAKGFDVEFEELALFREQVKLNAVFWRSKSHSVDFSRPQLTSDLGYPYFVVNVTFQAVVYNETDLQESKYREALLAQSKASAGLITGSLVAFTVLEFVISNSFWISIIWVAILVNTAITIACVYFNNSKM